MVNKGYLYSYIAPIWTYQWAGNMDTHKKLIPNADDQFGLHLLQTREQISMLKSMGFNKENISEILSLLHFNDDVNQHGFEYYQEF